MFSINRNIISGKIMMYLFAYIIKEDMIVFQDFFKKFWGNTGKIAPLYVEENCTKKSHPENESHSFVY